ncbi:Hypothetical predicted protein [Cloeon dipterum]|uniref:Uncharacterized protein n=1 Tax=Cloeon dipterum TaxID=197152 RepID=A0A8S1E1P8_9INSE|nr:Hypothetical predicted protein [Cloeon dipterum]
MIKTFLGIEDEFNAGKLAKMNAEYNRFLAVEKQQLDQYRFFTEVPKTYSQAVSLQKPAARPEKQLSDADGWKEVKRRKMKSTDVRDDERCDPAFKVVKARAGKPRGASAARLLVASTAKVDFSGARSHPPPARATGELVSLSPPARVGGAVPPLVHPLPNSSCVVDEKDAEPVSSENTAQESRGRENLAKVCRRDRASKSVKALAGSQRGASAARRTEICTAQAIENAGVRSYTPPAPLAGEHTNPPPSAASADGAYSCPADRISPPEVTTKPNRNRQSEHTACLCKEKKASLQELLDRKILMEAESYCHRFLRLNGSSSGTVTNDINMDTWAQFLGGLFSSMALTQHIKTPTRTTDRSENILDLFLSDIPELVAAASVTMKALHAEASKAGENHQEEEGPEEDAEEEDEDGGVCADSYEIPMDWSPPHHNVDYNVSLKDIADEVAGRMGVKFPGLVSLAVKNRAAPESHLSSSSVPASTLLHNQVSEMDLVFRKFHGNLQNGDGQVDLQNDVHKS